MTKKKEEPEAGDQSKADNQAVTEGGSEAAKPKGSEAAKPKGSEAAKDKGGDKAPEKKPEVEVICEGTLGPKLLKKGDRTTDPEYVALIGDSRNLVRAV